MPSQLPESINQGDANHIAHHEAIHTALNAPIPIMTGGDITAASFTPSLEHANECAEMNSASPQTFVVPADADVDYEVGVVLLVYQKGTGAVTVAPGTGVEIRYLGGVTGAQVIGGQDGEVSVRKRFANKWVLAGPIA